MYGAFGLQQWWSLLLEDQHGGQGSINTPLAEYQDGEKQHSFTDSDMECMAWAFRVNAGAVYKPGVLKTWFKVLISSLDCLLVVLALLGNTATLLILNHLRKQNIRLSCLLGSLVMSDLLTVISLVTFDLPHLWHDDFVWVLGRGTCKVAAFLQAVAVLVNSTTLIAIAVDRYLTIVLAHRHTPWPEWRLSHAIAFVSIVFPLSCGVSAPYVVYYGLGGPYLGYSMNGNLTMTLTCPDYFCWSEEASIHRYQVALVCITFLPLLFTFCACYTIVIHFLRGQPTLSHGHTRQLARTHKVMVTVTAIMVIFVVCRLPAWVLLLLPQPTGSHQASSRLAFSYAHYSLHTLTLCAPAFNPFLYSLVHQSCRHHLPAPLAWALRGISTPNKRVAPQRVAATTQPSGTTLTTALDTAHTLPRPVHLTLNAHLATLQEEATTQYGLNCPDLTWLDGQDSQGVTVAQISSNLHGHPNPRLPTLTEEDDPPSLTSPVLCSLNTHKSENLI
ncbi:RYamide receptor-like 1 [Homarus americanus]|uniref:RYamide receptor-like 1 n=1 Tax=Homarus americanus TaxID=6706 RepID=A0A8J5K9W7_HOMAM|nr:RYamide receptor-like 1 [Homarus americanus]